MKQFYVGLDLGRKWIYGTILDEKKRVVKEAKIECTIGAVEKFLQGMREIRGSAPYKPPARATPSSPLRGEASESLDYIALNNDLCLWSCACT